MSLKGVRVRSEYDTRVVGHEEIDDSCSGGKRAAECGQSGNCCSPASGTRAAQACLLSAEGAENRPPR